MTGQNDRQDDSLTSQAHDQAGHCPLTGRYFEPCNELKIKRWLVHMCPLSDIQALRNMWKVFQSSFLIVCVGM